jgi:hypothetical protein
VIHKRSPWIGLTIILVVLALAACSSLDEARGKADSVDEAVDLLQDLDDSSLWESLDDGLENLNDQAEGYIATISHVSGQGDVRIVVEVDSDGNASVTVSEADAETHYMLEQRPDDSPYNIYRREADDYFCETAGPAHRWFQQGIESLLIDMGLVDLGIQGLVVLEKDDVEVEIAGRDAIRYQLESRVPEALLILNDLEDTDNIIQPPLPENLTLSGQLYLDKNTLALVQLDMDYRLQPGDAPSEISFAVTQWGNSELVPIPLPGDLALPCAN